MNQTPRTLNALIACQDGSCYEKMQSLRNVVNVVGTVTTPEALWTEVQDASIGIVFFVGQGDEFWRNALLDAREESPNRLLALYGVDDHPLPAKQKWCESAELDDYLIFPKEQERLKQHLNSISLLQARYDEMIQGAHFLLDERSESQKVSVVCGSMLGPNFLEAPIFKTSYSPFQILEGQVLLAAPKKSGGFMIFLADCDDLKIPAASVTVPLAELFYAQVEKGVDLVAFVSMLQKELDPYLPHNVRFPYFVLDLSLDLMLSVIGGGMPPVIVNGSSKTSLFQASHSPIGSHNRANESLSVQKMQMNPGDQIFLFNTHLFANIPMTSAMSPTDWFKKLIKNKKKQGERAHLYDVILYEMCRKIGLKTLKENQGLFCLEIPCQESLQHLLKAYCKS